MKKNLIYSLILISTFTACKDEPAIEKNTFLKQLAADNDILIGTLYNYGYSNNSYNNYETYNKTVADEFNVISLEWEFAMDEIWTDEYSYDYTYLDKALLFAKNNNLTVRGTHLFWHATIPEWLVNGNFSQEQVKTLVKAYITSLFNHISSEFPGIMTDVNVVNEVIRDSYMSDTYGDLRETFWVEKLGTSYVDSAFVWVNNAFPEAKLFINEYGNEFQDEKQQRFLNFVTNLKNNNIPVHGIGLQAHFTIDMTEIYDDPFSQTDFEAALSQYADLGFEIQLTELDIRINDDQSGISDEKLNKQADLYKTIFEICLANKAVKTVSLWGFNDDLSYLNGNAEWLDQNRDWGLIFDEDFSPKPAYFSISETLE